MTKFSKIISAILFMSLSAELIAASEGLLSKRFERRFNEVIGAIHAKKLLEGLDSYNKDYSAHPEKLISLYTQERDKSFLKQLLSQSGLKKLSPGVVMGGVVRHRVGQDTIEYDAYSLIDGEITINQRPFTLAQSEPLGQLHKRLRLFLSNSQTSMFDFIIPSAHAEVDLADMLTIHAGGIINVSMTFSMNPNRQAYIEELFKALNKDVDQAQKSCTSTLSELQGARSVSIDDATVSLLGQLGVTRFTEPVSERLINNFLARKLNERSKRSERGVSGYQTCEDFSEQVAEQNLIANSKSEMIALSRAHGDVCVKMKTLGNCFKRVYTYYEDNELSRDADVYYSNDETMRVPGKVIDMGAESGLKEGASKTKGK